MRVQFTIVGETKPPFIPHCKTDVLPSEGDSVVIDGITRYVRTVEWYPFGDGGSDPFVYVVLGAHRP